ncbi:MAG: hypothetical protein R3F54_09420 [Alphaproteobacteria bacterium]
MTVGPPVDRDLPESLRPVPGGVAAEIMARADQDLVLSVRFLTDSQHLLQRHFQTYVQKELEKRGITFGDHPLLLPFIETHGAELAEFVTTGIGLHHQFRLQDFETMQGDPQKLLRLDIWNTLQSYIDKAEAHFVSGIGGLQQILAAVQEARGLRLDLPENKP